MRLIYGKVRWKKCRSARIEPNRCGFGLDQGCFKQNMGDFDAKRGERGINEDLLCLGELTLR